MGRSWYIWSQHLPSNYRSYFIRTECQTSPSKSSSLCYLAISLSLSFYCSILFFCRWLFLCIINMALWWNFRTIYDNNRSKIIVILLAVTQIYRTHTKEIPELTDAATKIYYAAIRTGSKTYVLHFSCLLEHVLKFHLFN